MKKSKSFISAFAPMYAPSFAAGLNRRDFLQRTTALSALAAVGLSKPLIGNAGVANTAETHVVNGQASAQPLPELPVFTPLYVSFTEQQQQTLEQVQLVLFPDDGDGPSAADLHAFDYLRWALTEEDNKADGDFEFIIKGIGWLNDLSQADYSREFVTLEAEQKNTLVEKISRSKSGKNWLSLLVYYLLEALTLDPLYGGNGGSHASSKSGIGWQWLKHQPGFPRPDAHTHFQNIANKENS